MSDTQHNGPQDLELLPPAQRAARYRELADMHLTLGQQAKVAEARASHLELAGLWTRLAASAERQAKAYALHLAARSEVRGRPNT